MQRKHWIYLHIRTSGPASVFYTVNKWHRLLVVVTRFWLQVVTATAFHNSIVPTNSNKQTCCTQGELRELLVEVREKSLLIPHNVKNNLAAYTLAAKREDQHLNNTFC